LSRAADEREGRPYLSVKLDDPTLMAPINGALFLKETGATS
jgi:uncharacterized protein (DUF736 family)